MIGNFFRSLTGRMLLGILLIHALLIPLLFAVILRMVQQDYQAQFIDYARSQSHTLANLLAQIPEHAQIEQTINDLMLAGEVLYAELLPDKAQALTLATPGITDFQEDFFFGQHGDHVYYIAIPVTGPTPESKGTLRLGYDEVPTLERIQILYRFNRYLATAYIGFSLLFILFFGHRLTKSIRQLRTASRKIASGHTAESLSVVTNITEVSDLAADLESMRRELVSREQETLKTNALLRDSETYTRAVLENINEGIIVISEDDRVATFNSAAEQIFGYTDQEIIGQNINLLIPDHGQGLHANYLRHSDISDTPPTLGVSREVVGRRKNGTHFPLELKTNEVRIESGRLFIASARDITARKESEQRILHLATHDTLTSLPNRNLLLDRIEQVLVHVQRSHLHAAVLFIDLDKFKTINDTLGHDVGDLLLQAVTRRLIAGVRTEDTVARQGGDEFIVLLPSINNAQDAGTVAEKLLEALVLPYQINNKELYISASIGIAIYPDDGQDVNTLLKNSDTAMYHAKEAGRNNCQFYTLEMNQIAAELHSLGTDLHHALARKELLLHYQPIIDVITGKLMGMEALLRWQHPDKGLILPRQFIPLAEEIGLIVPIGEWIVEAACQQLQNWHKQGYDIPKLAINLSVKQFRQKTLAATILRIMANSGIAAHRIELEITESLLMENVDDAIETLRELNKLGMAISIDDFGTGYSSLSYLKRFPIDTLKIDHSFVMDIATDPDDASIVKAIITLAHSMQMKVIAEGVETDAQLAFLRQHGCDQYQGYYFSQPLSATEVIKILPHA
ncbi:MAG: EAL domain-containing protein [Gallionellaceae bacterium]|nr:EAL domain-containing protein [Gallionellaceae bacterium]